MKSPFLIGVFFLFINVIYAQIPQGMNYQAVARNAQGQPLINQSINAKFSILNGSANGTVVYVETHVSTTNAYGLFNLTIGQGTATTGTFSTIDWSTGTKFLKAEINNVLIGTSQFLSVPYALYANKANSSIITVNNENAKTVRPPQNSVVNIEGTIALNATYQNLEENNLTIMGGIVNGNGQTLRLNNSLVSGVVFNNVNIDGNAVHFEGCTFNNVSGMPSSASVTGCKFIGGNISSNNLAISFMNNCTVIGTTIPRINKITNSLISNSTIGSTSTSNAPAEQISNCQINSSTIYLSKIFLSNDCDESQISVRPNTGVVNITGNNFNSSNSGSILDVNMNSGSRFVTNVSNNIFTPSSGKPNSQYIRLYGTYTGIKSIVKINNNTVYGGTVPFISVQSTGAVDVTVNDNELFTTGGLGVSTGGGILEQHNRVH